MKIIIILLILVITIIIIKSILKKNVKSKVSTNNNSNINIPTNTVNEITVKNEYKFNGKVNKSILTEHELVFFQQLKRITDQYELYIFPKVRMSDLISTDNKSDLWKINSKHIDFTICTKFCAPLLFIELDDSFHNNPQIIENDNKKDIIFKSVGRSIFRVKPNKRNEALYSINKILKDKVTYLKH